MRLIVMLLIAMTLALPAESARYGEEEVAALVAIAREEKEPEGRRAQAVRELEHTEVRTHLSVLRKLLREERSPDIRLSAACVLAALGDRKSPRDLLLVTAYEGGRTAHCTRSDVYLALARTGDPVAEMHLEKALKGEAPRDEPYFYADVCRGLGILNTPGTWKLLRTSLRDGPS